MRKGIRLIASVLTGAIFMLNLGIVSYAAESVTYLSEEEIQKQKEDGTEKTAEEIKEELLAKARALPVETNELKNWPKGPEICGESGIVMDMDNGAILYGKSIDKKYYPASITKIMTALVALENSEMTDLVTFSENSIQCQRSGYAHIAMKSGEQITMRDALHAMMLASANEVAYAIGETVGGTHENFVKMMNDCARKLGCENTNFVNTNGIFDENHYVSARDMALIAKEAFSKSELLDIMRTSEYTIPATNLEDEARTFQQKHKMMVQGKYYDQRCIGGKTGYTDLSYNTLVTALEENGRRIVVVILGSRDETYENTKAMADYAFQNFEQISIAENADVKELIGIPENASVTVPKGVTFQELDCEADESGEITYSYQKNPVGTMTAKLTKEQKIELLQIQKDDVQPDKEDKEEKETWLTTEHIIMLVIVGILILILLIVILVVKVRKRRARIKRRREMRRRRQQEMRRRNQRREF